MKAQEDKIGKKCQQPGGNLMIFRYNTKDIIHQEIIGVHLIKKKTTKQNLCLLGQSQENEKISCRLIKIFANAYLLKDCYPKYKQNS